MLAKADEDQLHRVCANDETLVLARKLVPLARARTKQGSGHHLPDLATGLPAICAYIASNHLNNDDVAFENARQATCLQKRAFDKALRTLTVVLGSELNYKKGTRGVAYDALHETYSIQFPYTSFVPFLRQAEHSLVQLGAQHNLKVDSPDVRYGIFFWACSTIKVKDFPTLNEFAQDNNLVSRRLAPTIKVLNERCNTLSTKLLQASENPSQPSSPQKLFQASSPRTPRRSPSKPLRELPTRESVKKQRQLSLTDERPSDSSKSDGAARTAPPESPTRKRKLETPSPNPSPSKRRLAFPPATSSTAHTSHLTTPVKPKVNPTPTIPSPLRQTARFVLQQEVDDNVEEFDDDEVANGVNRSLEVDLVQFGGEGWGRGEETTMKIRRFRPVYQDHRQWFTRDARILRIWKDASRGVGVEV